MRPQCDWSVAWWRSDDVVSPLRHRRHPPPLVLCHPPGRLRRPPHRPPRLQVGGRERSASVATGSDIMTKNYLLPTVPVIFLVLLVHLLFLLLVYVRFSVLIVLLEEKTRVRHPKSRRRQRLRQEMEGGLPFHWWRCPCRSPSPPGASSPSGPAEDKHMRCRCPS